MKEIEGYDVVVAGGGPGGFAAAVAAARSGAKCCLLEREGCLGGAATTMMVNPFMSDRTSLGPDGKTRTTVNAGIYKELRERLAKSGEKADGASFDDETLKRVLDELVREAGVDVIFHAALFDCEVEDDGSGRKRVVAARFAHNSGPLRVTGKVFVDGTGDGLLAASAGAEVMKGNEDGHVMPMTLFFALSGVDHEKAPQGWGPEYRRSIAAEKDGPPRLENTHLSCIARAPNGFLYFNAIRIPGDTLSPEEVSRAEAEGRRLVANFVEWLRARVPGHENCVLAKTGAHVGIRESRRIVGDYVLNIDDFDRAAKFEDGVASCAYNVDIHGQKPNQTTFRQLPPGEWYHIPYRCLTPKGITNLLVASRSVSADVVAHSSLRIMPVVMCIGQAAGFASAMSLPLGNVRAVDVSELRKRIVDAGGVL